MKYAETGQGSYSDDDSLEAIEAPLEEEGQSKGFGLPGQSAVGTVGFFRLADIGNEDENSTRLTALGDEPKATIDVVGEPGVVSNQGLSSVSPGSLSPLINGVTEGKKMSLSSKIAFVMENGEPFCHHCERNFVPEALGPRMACTYCGCGRPNDDHNIGQGDFNGQDLLAHAEGETVKDEDAGRNIIKQDATVGSKRDSADEFLDAFSKTANDSQLYYKGYMDAETGKPLDEDMALLSKDYYNGYEQYKFYNKTPQQSEGQKLFNIKPNSNEIPRQGQMTPGEADRGPLELTDGTNHATASKVLGLYEGFKTAEYTGTDVSRMSKEQREAGSVCKSPSGLSQAHIDTYGGSATCGRPATGRTDNGAPTCGGSNCGKKVKPLGTISSKISSIFPIDVIENFFEGQ